MRRMIPENQAEGLRRLNNNIVINDDGTLVEIGGNVKVESIEQLGQKRTFLVQCTSWDDVKIGETYTCKFPNYDCDLSGFSEFVEGVFDADSFIPEIDEDNISTRSDGASKRGFGFSPGAGVTFSAFLDADEEGQYGWAKIPANQEFKITVSSIQKTTTPGTHLYSFMYKEVEGYAPFFTEEQYAAILELVENKDELLALIENA